MAITDWTPITDGTMYNNASINEKLDSTYCCRTVAGAGSSNFAFYNYNNKSEYSAVDNVKVSALFFNPYDFYKDPTLFESLSWTTGGNYTVSGNVITRTANGSNWINSTVSTVSLSNALNGTGLSWRAARAQNYYVALSAEAAPSSYDMLDYAVYINTSNQFSIYSNNMLQMPSTYASNPTTVTSEMCGITPGDYLSIDYNNGYLYFRINGIAMYRTTATVTLPLYAHVILYTMTDSIEIVANRTTAMTYYPALTPLLFSRLQGTTHDSACYAFAIRNGFATFLKGNLNSDNIASNVLLTGNSITYISTNNISFDTTTIDSNTVQLKAYVTDCLRYDNEITTTAVGTDTQKRLGIPSYMSTVADGKFGRAAHFNGRYSRFYCPKDVLAQTTAADGNCSIEFWFKPFDVNKGTLFSTIGYYETSWATARYCDWGTVKFHNGRLYFGTTHNYQNYWITLTPSSLVAPNQWHHFLFTYEVLTSFSNIRWSHYLDGVQVYTGSGFSAPSAYAGTYHNDYICSYFMWGVKYAPQHVQGYSDFYKGLMDSVHVTRTVYTSGNVTSRYASQNAGTDVETDANSLIMLRFEDSPQTYEVLSYTDTNSPIIQGGKCGFGVHNPLSKDGETYFDNVKIYTEY